jgi:hypothetical protein
MMSKNDEVEAALTAFRQFYSCGLENEPKFRYAMNQALDAADRVRNEVPKVECDACKKMQDPRVACPEYAAQRAQPKKGEELSVFGKKLAYDQQPLGALSQQVLTDNAWELYGR